MTPAQRELWIALTEDGSPIGPGDGNEAAARSEAERLTRDVPEFGPYRVQKYVTQDRLDHSHEWYASRWERLDQLVREEATDEFKVRWFNVMANGKAEVTEPPTFQSLLNKARFDTDRERKRAERAEAALAALLTGAERDPESQVWRGDLVPVGGVMSALIGAMETEDGLAVVRYCGHLERLLKEARAERDQLP